MIIYSAVFIFIDNVLWTKAACDLQFCSQRLNSQLVWYVFRFFAFGGKPGTEFRTRFVQSKDYT